MKSIALAICLYWWTAGVRGLAQTEPPDAYTEAASAFQQGKLEQAQHALRTAIAAEADRPDLLGLLGVANRDRAKEQYGGDSELSGTHTLS